MLSWVVIIRSTLRRRSPKSLPLNPFADPHPLTPVPSILYKKHGGRGTKPLRRSDVHPEGGHGTRFASRMNLSPLESAVAAKHSVLPVFSRNRLTSSLLESTLLSLLASVDSKWFTGRLTRLESPLTKNTRGVGPLIGLSFRSMPRSLCGNPLWSRNRGSRATPSAIRPIAEQVLWCNNPQRYEISLRSEETTPLPPVSKNSERTSGTVHRRSRSQAARTYERTCKKA